MSSFWLLVSVLATAIGVIAPSRSRAETPSDIDQRRMDDQLAIEERLYNAVRTSDAAGLRRLLEEGADPNASIFGSPLLSIACEEPSRLECARSLLAAGADPNAADDTGHAVIHSAAASGSLAVLELVVAAGADARAITNQSWSALHFWARQCEAQDACLDLLLRQGIDLNGLTAHQKTPLFLAIDASCTANAIRLLEAGALPTCSEVDTGRTPLFVASERGELNLIKRLLTAGANPSEATRTGESPLMAAAAFAAADVVVALVRAGSDVNSKDSAGDTALLRAARSSVSDIDTVEVLLRAGASPDARDQDGSCAIHYYCRALQPEPMRLLCCWPNQVSISDKAGRTPLMLVLGAIEWPELVERLQSWRSALIDESAREPQGERLILIESKMCEDTRRLVDRHAAAYCMMEYLIAHGAGTNCADDGGQTPLMLAAAHGSLSIVARLMLEGADRDLVDHQNRTALDYACRREDVEGVLIQCALRLDCERQKP